MQEIFCTTCLVQMQVHASVSFASCWARVYVILHSNDVMHNNMIHGASGMVCGDAFSFVSPKVWFISSKGTQRERYLRLTRAFVRRGTRIHSAAFLYAMQRNARTGDFAWRQIFASAQEEG